MKRKPIKPMHADHVNVTPLIDVMMCLIIFFLLCGQFALDESNDTVTIPKAQEGMKMSVERGTLLVNVVPVKEKPPRYEIRAQTVQSEELLAYLVKEKRDNPELKVIVRADAGVEYN